MKGPISKTPPPEGADELYRIDRALASGLCVECDNASQYLCMDCARCPKCEHSENCKRVWP